MYAELAKEFNAFESSWPALVQSIVGERLLELGETQRAGDFLVLAGQSANASTIAESMLRFQVITNK